MTTLYKFDKGNLFNFMESFRCAYLKGKYIYWKHTGTESFVIEDSLKFDLSTVTPNDPKLASDQKFLNTIKEPLAKDLFNHVSLKSTELGSGRSVLSVLEQ